jgi:hypothetical protein
MAQNIRERIIQPEFCQNLQIVIYHADFKQNSAFVANNSADVLWSLIK